MTQKFSQILLEYFEIPTGRKLRHLNSKTQKQQPARGSVAAKRKKRRKRSRKASRSQ